MTAHQTKKLDVGSLLDFRDRFNLPLTDQEVESLAFYRPDEDSPEISYLTARRVELGGYLPLRAAKAANPAPPRPLLAEYAGFALAAAGKEMSTTMVVARLLSGLLKDAGFGPRIVPIVADEARTFGMVNLFRQIGIYAPQGQLYEPEDKESLLYYREVENGQLIEEGITEAGAVCTWTAAGTAYSSHDVETLPFYIYYSIFGFQRVGDHLWAAADQRTRGFLLGATAGRTTLSGEGLQHQDGSSHLLAASYPNCRAYDPAFAYELAVIVDYGMQRMLEEKRDEFFYLTVMNESYAQPSMPKGAEEGIVRGLYRLSSTGTADQHRVLLVGSGTILLEVIAAAEILHAEFDIASHVFSATSFTELAREAASFERDCRLAADKKKDKPLLNELLDGAEPVIVATDYVRAYPAQIAPYLDKAVTILGTDGFGRSADRKSLRSFFEVDRNQIVLAALESLVRDNRLPGTTLQQAVDSLAVENRGKAPWRC